MNNKSIVINGIIMYGILILISIIIFFPIEIHAQTLFLENDTVFHKQEDVLEENLVHNGSFSSDLEGWELYSNNGSGNASVINESTGNSYANVTSKTLVSLDQTIDFYSFNKAKYEVSFDAKASKGEIVDGSYFLIVRSETTPSEKVDIDLSDTWKHYSVIFNGEYNILFHLTLNFYQVFGGGLDIDNVKVYEIKE